MADRKALVNAAAKGFMGQSALLDPSSFADLHAPAQPLVPVVKPEEETAFQQAVRELPGDIKDAFSPAGIARSSGLMYNSVKDMLSGNLEPDILKQNKK